MKLSLAVFAVAAAPSVANAFVPVSSARSSSALSATIENTKLIPPLKVEDLTESAAEYYGKNVQTTYG